MDNQIQELKALVNALSVQVKAHEGDINEMGHSLKELQNVLVSLDKSSAVNDEKLSTVIREINSLNAQYEKLKLELDTINANKGSFVEKIMITLVGSAIGAIFSYLSSK